MSDGSYFCFVRLDALMTPFFVGAVA
ncbi:MAG: hypothetical protein QOE47_660, partial [Pyrinomonadaceae bacterium]|nr:hypothetical protein [Pyrinomonadaceae bacterium]